MLDPFNELNPEVTEILAKLPKGTIVKEKADGSLWVRVRKGHRFRDYGQGREFEA